MIFLRETQKYNIFSKLQYLLFTTFFLPYMTAFFILRITDINSFQTVKTAYQNCSSFIFLIFFILKKCIKMPIKNFGKQFWNHKNELIA